MSARRVLIVTLILVAFGVVLGGLLGALLGIATAFIRNGPAIAEGVPGILFVAGLAGGALGGVLAPITAWLLLRHVPLGRAMGYTALGTVIGAAGGVFLRDAWWLATALLGFTLTAIWLRLSTRTAVAPAAGAGAEDAVR